MGNQIALYGSSENFRPCPLSGRTLKALLHILTSFLPLAAPPRVIRAELELWNLLNDDMNYFVNDVNYFVNDMT